MRLARRIGVIALSFSVDVGPESIRNAIKLEIGLELIAKHVRVLVGRCRVAVQQRMALHHDAVGLPAGGGPTQPPRARCSPKRAKPCQLESKKAVEGAGESMKERIASGVVGRGGGGRVNGTMGRRWCCQRVKGKGRSQGSQPERLARPSQALATGTSFLSSLSPLCAFNLLPARQSRFPASVLLPSKHQQTLLSSNAGNEFSIVSHVTVALRSLLAVIAAISLRYCLATVPVKSAAQLSPTRAAFL